MGAIEWFHIDQKKPRKGQTILVRQTIQKYGVFNGQHLEHTDDIWAWQKMVEWADVPKMRPREVLNDSQKSGTFG